MLELEFKSELARVYLEPGSQYHIELERMKARIKNRVSVSVIKIRTIESNYELK